MNSALDDSCRAVKSQLSFLDLPYSVREVTYLYTNLVLCCTLPLNGGAPPDDTPGMPWDREGPEPIPDHFNLRFGVPVIGPCRSGPFDDLSQCLDEVNDQAPLFRNLFLVCRKVSAETRKLFYTKNQFVSHRCANNGLLPLSTPPFDRLGWLTSLRIELNTVVSTHFPDYQHTLSERRQGCSCICNRDLPQTEEPGGYAYCLCKRSDEPIDISTSRGQRALKELEKAVSSLKNCVKPDQLELGFICDSKDLATAQAFSKPLESLPRLKNCSIRLSIQSDESIRQQCRETVCRLTKDAILDLSRMPTEIKLNIFHFMGLIAPKDIQWKGKGQRPGFSLHHDYFQNQHVCVAVKGWIHSNSAVASSCQCWTFPAELFRLDKFFHKEATRLFFSKNHFLILPDSGYGFAQSPYDNYPYDRTAPPYSYFPQSFSQDALESLRSLQFVLPLKRLVATFQNIPLSPSYDWSSRLEHWDTLLRQIACYASPHKLSLTLDFNTLECYPTGQHSIDSADWKQQISQLSGSVNQVFFETAVGLKSFHIYVPDRVDTTELDISLKGWATTEVQAIFEKPKEYSSRSTGWYTYLMHQLERNAT